MYVDPITIASRTWKVNSKPSPRISGPSVYIELRGNELVLVCKRPDIFSLMEVITNGRVIARTTMILELAFEQRFLAEVARCIGCKRHRGVGENMSHLQHTS
jgi:hypothetical protein